MCPSLVRILLKLCLGKVDFVISVLFSTMCDTTFFDTDPEPFFSESVFVDNLQLIDPALHSNKLGDTCTGVLGILLGKSQFYIEINASQYIIETVQDGCLFV